MRYAFLFGSLAVSVYPVRNPFQPDEAGARVDIQRADTAPPIVVASSALVTTTRELLWRADLFSDLNGEPGNWGRAHFHTKTYSPASDAAAGATPQSLMPGDRHWDPGLSEDALVWIADQLGDLESTLRVAHADQLATAEDYADLRAHISEVVRAVETCRASALAVPVGSA